MNLDSRALAFAGEHGRDVVDRLGDLRAAAEHDAADLVQRARAEREQLDRDVLLEAPACLDIAAHMVAEGLTNAIYLHALLHAGLVQRAGTGQAYDVCPLCGDDLPRTEA